MRDEGLRDEGLAVLRGVTGGLMAGHGAQKLFGAFKGPGLQGTAGFMEHLGLQPGKLWGTAAALSEFGGGTLTTLGLLYPLGPIGTISSMVMATAKAHWGKPIWVTEGGAETPLLNIAVAASLMMIGPGRYSLDEALGIRLPKWLVATAFAAAGAGVGYGILNQPVRQWLAERQPDKQLSQSAVQPDATAQATTQATAQADADATTATSLT